MARLDCVEMLGWIRFILNKNQPVLHTAGEKTDGEPRISVDITNGLAKNSTLARMRFDKNT